ncbi:MAG TPA: metallophosphoesterase [Geminicoccaceae bacterium]|nr:metallophosphoesterase [Geminicoccaceae bacterium]
MAPGRGGVAALVGAALAACSTAPAPPRPERVLAAYTLLAPTPGGGTVPLARAVVGAGRACPELATERGPVPMTARTNPNPATFPVEVCEAIYGLGERASVAGLDLPEVAADPRRVVVVGDTGCGGGTWQDCADPAKWPFAGLTAAAAKEPPDVVVHVGDYVYRGTPSSIEVNGVRRGTYNAGNYRPEDVLCQMRDPYVSQNGPGSSLPDSWEAWRADFFAPAAPLLRRAPWVAARGNHELCSRAGPGYFYLLDPSSGRLGGELSCPPQEQGSVALKNVVFPPPYRLELGALRLVVMDTANACDQHANFAEAFARQFAEVQRLAAGGPAWLVSHRPIWGVDGLDTAAGRFQTSNVTLQQALRRGPGAVLPAGVELVLSGHIHRFEALSFPGATRPPQLVVGNSGVRLAEDALSGRFATELDGVPTRGLALNEFGFLDAQPTSGGGWTGQLMGPGAAVLARCGSPAPGPDGEVCVAPGG